MGWLCLIVFIICTTILGGMYLHYCNENEIGVFRNTNMYDKEKIERLEDRISKLERRIN